MGAGDPSGANKTGNDFFLFHIFRLMKNISKIDEKNVQEHLYIAPASLFQRC